MTRGEVALRTLVKGFEEAYGRLIGRAGDSRQPGQGPPVLPLFEALNWVVTIDDRLRRDRESDEWWKQMRDGETLRAVRYARNRVHHQWTDAIGYGPPARHEQPKSTVQQWGAWEQPADAFQGASWRWRPSLPQGSKPDPLGEQFYGQHLAGEFVRDTLLRLHAMFSTLPETESGSTRGYGEWPSA